MEDDPSWPDLLAGYKEALQVFERSSKALTAALIDRSTSPDDLSIRFAAEAAARDAVVLSRMRIASLWRESEQPLPLPFAQADDDQLTQ